MGNARFEDIENENGEESVATRPPVVPTQQAQFKVKTENYFQVTGFPSKMRLYPEGTVIEARPLKVLDVKLLSSMNEKNFDKVINEVLTRTVRGIDINKILVADKYYLIFWLRANTYKDSSYTMKFHCSKCESESEYNFTLDCLDINYLSDSVDFSRELTLPLCKSKVMFKLPNLGDEEKLEQFKNSFSKSMRDMDPEVLAVANVLTKVDGEELSLYQKYEFLVNLFPGDYAYVESYIESFDIGIAHEMEVKCNKCGGTSPMGISFHKEFFIPRFEFGGRA